MEKIKKGLENGRTISQYPTGRIRTSTAYFRWDDTLEVVNCKSVWALKRKGYEVIINISDKIVK
jgi:hypothetical protein